jgi:hypothetical protein
VNRQLSIKRQVSEPLLTTQTKHTTKVNSYSEHKLDQLVQLQQQCSKQWKFLKATANNLAHLEKQVKKIKETDIILTSCDECAGAALNVCGKCLLYIEGQIERYPSAPDTIEKDQLRIAVLDEGQEDAYWL